MKHPQLLIVAESSDQLIQEGFDTIDQAIVQALKMKGRVRLSVTDDNSTYDFYLDSDYLNEPTPGFKTPTDQTTAVIPFEFIHTYEYPGILTWSCKALNFCIHATPYYENTRGISYEVWDSFKDTQEYTGNIKYIGDEEYWANQSNHKESDPQYQHYIKFMTETGLKQIITAHIK